MTSLPDSSFCAPQILSQEASSGSNFKTPPPEITSNLMAHEEKKYEGKNKRNVKEKLKDCGHNLMEKKVARRRVAH